MKTKTTLVLCFSAVCLLGCATPDKKPEGHAEIPPIELTSSLPAKVVAMCISDNWDEITVPLSLVASDNIKPTSDGFSVTVVNNNLATTGVLVDIKDTKSGSTTRFSSNAEINKFGIEEVVRKCQ